MDLDRKRFISSLVKSAHYHLSAQARFLGSLEEIMMDELTLLTPTDRYDDYQVSQMAIVWTFTQA